MNGLNKTNIDWTLNPDGTPGYTLNIWTGCLNHKEGYCLGGDFPCYAHKLAHGRVKSKYLANTILPRHDEPGHNEHHLDPFYPRFWPSRLEGLAPHNGKARGIFVNSMSEWAGSWVPDEWIKKMFDGIRATPGDRFYLCTKQYRRLPEFSPYPENCWIGATVTSSSMLAKAAFHLTDVKAPVKFLSIEPFLSPLPIPKLLKGILEVAGVNWIIIGACTGTLDDLKPTAAKYPELKLMPLKTDKDGRKWLWSLQPDPDWVRDIISAADKLKIPVWLKHNLMPLLNHNDMQKYLTLWGREKSGAIKFPVWARQEMPKL